MDEQEKKNNLENQENSKIPDELPVLPLSNVVVFPMTMAPLVVGSEQYVQMIEHITAKQKIIALVTQKKHDIKNPQGQDLYSIGTASTILQMVKNPDNTMKILVRGIKRIRINEYVQTSPYFTAQVTELDNIIDQNVELEALVRMIRDLFGEMVSLMPQFPDELKAVFQSITNPGEVADFVATTTNMDLAERQAVLEELNVFKRLDMLQKPLNREIKILEISTKIKTDVNTDIDKTQRDFYLRKQLDAIKKELGEDEPGTAKEAAELAEKIKQSKMNDEARKESERELERLKMMHPSSAEYSVVRTYLDWMISLPWEKETEDNLDLHKASEILDRDHYDLEKPKERILEYLGVRKLKPDIKGPILCFSGPPGVGKTSLGRSIASALGREFIRLSLGGVRDEAEIRGHRRTYVGALPGRIIQGIKRVSSLNPVFMIDEVDKIGADFRGDPSSALLEVLDPEQNNTFSDHYLDVPFDLSKVMFITTANVRDTIPPPLLDRMEVIELPGYMEEEKIGIARKYLIPKGIEMHGLPESALKFDDEALMLIIRDYTKEAGLRNLEREIASICRKVARNFAEDKTDPVHVDVEKVHEFLGVKKFFSETKIRTEKAGVATGLAWTQTGGDILFIESTSMKGSSGLILTGQLGDVMKESARAALSLVRSKAEVYGISEDCFKDSELHIHVPAGAIPKDGPSAGLALVISLVSLLKDKPLLSDVAATGEITLRGTILPVGGIREKVLAGRRAGIKRIILPKLNEKDLVDVPENLRSQLTFHLVEDVDEVLELDIFNKK